MGSLSNKKQSKILLGFVCLVSSVSLSGIAHADDEQDNGIIKMGTVQSTDLGIERGLTVSGRAMLVTNEDGISSAYAQVVGLSAESGYGAHVHDLPCSLGGGGHYKNDVDISGTVEANEIWLSFITDVIGTGLGQGSGNFDVRPEAQSIVVHDTDGGRVACADLKSQNKGALVAKGDMIKFSDGSSFGSAVMGRSNGSTLSILSLSGLIPNTTYGSHVHDLPCNVKSGGGHYKIDPSVDAAVVENEIWLTLTTDADGNGQNTIVTEGHVARPEAQSVVVHAPDGSRVGCANLEQKVTDEFKTSGHVITTAIGLAKGFYLSGYATMERESEGETEVKVKVDGLDANTTYATHVHDLPCKLGGGGHYKIDPTIIGTEASNEIWPVIKTNRSGRGKGKAKVNHLARPEAQSIVIHDPEDGSRIGCFDLD